MEISRQSALALIEKIQAALASGDTAHAKPVACERPALAASPAELVSLF